MCEIAAVQVATGAAKEDDGAENDDDDVVKLIVLPLLSSTLTRFTATAVAGVGVLT